MIFFTGIQPRTGIQGSRFFCLVPTAGDMISGLMQDTSWMDGNKHMFLLIHDVSDTWACLKMGYTPPKLQFNGWIWWTLMNQYVWDTSFSDKSKLHIHHIGSSQAWFTVVNWLTNMCFTLFYFQWDPFVNCSPAQDEWRYYHDPVVRPAKGHLWATGFEDDGEHGKDAWWWCNWHWLGGCLFRFLRFVCVDFVIIYTWLLAGELGINTYDDIRDGYCRGFDATCFIGDSDDPLLESLRTSDLSTAWLVFWGLEEEFCSFDVFRHPPEMNKEINYNDINVGFHPP